MDSLVHPSQALGIPAVDDPTISPHRVQLSRAKGWRMPPNTVKVDRTTRWGNPFRVDQIGAAEAVRRYQVVVTTPGAYFENEGGPDKGDQILAMARVIASIHELRGRNLACWCRMGEPCHADVLLELANAADPSTAGTKRSEVSSKNIDRLSALGNRQGDAG